MMKKMAFLMILFFIMPVVALAKNDLSVTCDKTILKNGEETNCKIEATELDFIVTNISAKLNVGPDLEVISSSYDDTIWRILDSIFDVKEINLMKEKVEMQSSLPVATFKIKAINSAPVTSEITLKEVTVGDDNYEDKELNIHDTTIELDYQETLPEDKPDEPTEEDSKEQNPSTSDRFSPILIVGIFIFLGYLIIATRKLKENN